MIELNCGTMYRDNEIKHYTHKQIFNNDSIILSLMLDGSAMPKEFDSQGRVIEWSFLECIDLWN